MDNKTTDKGWAAMRSMLDREMPEKRRRLFGWWWFSLLLLPIVVYGGWHWMKSAPAPTHQRLEKGATPIIAHKTPTAPSNAPQSAPVTAPLNAESKVTETPESSITTTAYSVPSNKSKKTITLPDAETSGTQTEKGLPPVTPIPSLLPITEPGLIAAAESNVTTQPLSLLALPIATQTIGYQNKNPKAPHLFAQFPMAKPFQKTATRHWAFGATTAISADQPQRINGFSTGLTVDYKFNRKWGLRSGLLYNLYTPQEKNKPVASVQSEDYTSFVEGKVIVFDFITGQQLASNSNQDFYNDSLSGNVFIPVNRLQRLEIPINAFWQVAKPLKLIGGLSLTRTLTAKSDQQNYTDEYIIKLADQASNDGASKLSSNELDNWSADALVGFGLKLGRSFELGLTAKLPLNKISGLVKADENASMGASASRESIGSTKKQSNPFLSLYGTLFF